MKKDKTTTNTMIIVSALAKQATPILKRLSSTTVKTKDSYELAGAQLKALTEIEKAAIEKKKAILDPLKKVESEIVALFQPFLTKLADAKAEKKLEMVDFQTKLVDQKTKLLTDFAEGKIKTTATFAKKQEELNFKSATSKVRNQQVLEIVNAKKIPAKYLVPDEAAIMADLKEGIKVPGCVLVVKPIIVI